MFSKLMKRSFVALATVVIAAAAPSQAQEPVVIPAGGEGAPVAPAAQGPAFGPIVGPDYISMRPRYGQDDRSMMNYKATHTIVISTLALVVIVVLLVLLIA